MMTRISVATRMHCLLESLSYQVYDGGGTEKGKGSIKGNGNENVAMSVNLSLFTFRKTGKLFLSFFP